MLKTKKVTISLPNEDFKAIEKIRKVMGFDRSAAIDRAIRFWIKHLKREGLIKRYEEGYTKEPEDIREIAALEKTQAEAFEEEGLK